MIFVGPLSVPDTVGVVSAALDLLSLDMSSDIAVQLDPNATDTDTVDIYGSNIFAAAPGLTLLSQLLYIGSIGEQTPNLTTSGTNPLPGSFGQFSGGRALIQIAAPRTRYLYVIRRSGVTAGLTFRVTGQETAGAFGGGVASVTGTAPIVSSGGGNPAISITPATDVAAGSLSAADKTKLDTLVLTQGGNAFTANLTAGTTDNFDVRLISNNVRRFTILKSGEVTVGPADPGVNVIFSVQGLGTQAISLFSGTGGIAIDSSTGTLQLNGNLADRTTAIGGTLGASPLNLFAGSGFVSLTAPRTKLLPPPAGGAGNTNVLAFFELAANGATFVGFKAPDLIAANVVWTLPAADATVAGQSLTSNAAGVLSWATPAPASSPVFQASADTCSALALIQRIPAGEAAGTQAITPDGTQAGFVAQVAGTIKNLAIRFTGNAGNAAGQTGALRVYKNGVAAVTGTPQSTANPAPTTQLDVVNVPYVAGDFIQLALVLSAALTSSLSSISATAG